MKRLTEDPSGQKRLADAFVPHLEGAGIPDPPQPLVMRAVVNLATRASTLAEMVPKARFYFRDPENYDPTAAGKLLTPALGPRLDRLLARLQSLTPWTEAELEGACRQLAGELGVKLVDLAQPIRFALTGETASPPVFSIMADLGRETTLRRLRALRARVPAA